VVEHSNHNPKIRVCILLLVEENVKSIRQEPTLVDHPKVPHSIGKQLALLANLAKNQHSSLFFGSVIDEKRFYNVDTTESSQIVFLVSHI
jgi:hypothetical protein